MDTHEYRIYTEIAYLIFKKCLDESGIIEERGWPAKLSDTLDRRFKNNHLDAKALSDLFNRIKRSKSAENTLEEMVISERTLYLLAEFAGIKDYKACNINYKGIPVVYTATPFSFFNMLRIPSDGWLTRVDDRWTYQTADVSMLFEISNTFYVKPYQMPGDQLPLWVKVEYKDETGNTRTACFAQIKKHEPLTFSNPQPLLDFFEQFQGKS